MGLFDLLFGRGKPKNVTRTGDRIWLSADAKFAGLARELAQRSRSDSVAILLVAHFPDVCQRLETACASAAPQVPVKAVLARDLSPDIASALALDGSAMLDMIVAERHPLPSVDQQIEQFASELPCRCRISYHLSLDDAVIKAFAGEWVRSILMQLGMTADEAIESAMVSRRIQQAQKKIEGMAHGRSEAESAAQWFERNCPELSEAAK